MGIGPRPAKVTPSRTYRAPPGAAEARMACTAAAIRAALLPSTTKMIVMEPQAQDRMLIACSHHPHSSTSLRPGAGPFSFSSAWQGRRGKRPWVDEGGGGGGDGGGEARNAMGTPVAWKLAALNMAGV